MQPTGQLLVAPNGHRWFFDSGALRLDLGYTGRLRLRVAAWEYLHSSADLETCLPTGSAHPDVPAGPWTSLPRPGVRR